LCLWLIFWCSIFTLNFFLSCKGSSTIHWRKTAFSLSLKYLQVDIDFMLRSYPCYAKNIWRGLLWWSSATWFFFWSHLCVLIGECQVESLLFIYLFYYYYFIYLFTYFYFFYETFPIPRSMLALIPEFEQSTEDERLFS